MEAFEFSLQQQWPLPANPRPIVIIGAGGIVHDSHLPAYAKAGFPVQGIFDIAVERSKKMAQKFGIPVVHSCLEEALHVPNVVFDIAIPPNRILSVLESMPDRAAVLIQKPLGTDLTEAKRIVDLCREKQLTAAVNFQFRFSPAMLAVRNLIQIGHFGQLVDIDVHFNYREPWELFPFLKSQPRVEMLIVSIHYFDWIRTILGEPEAVYARSISHPEFPGIESTRTSAILDYGDRVRCCLSLNNTWKYGSEHEACRIRIEGTRGAALIDLGCLINYPAGRPDRLEVTKTTSTWQVVPLEGSWFPDAFHGPMANLQRFISGEDEQLWTEVNDAVKTMRLIESLYRSDQQGATSIVL